MKDFNQLPAHVWPRNTTRDANGVVTLAGVPLTDIVAEYGAPVMVFDEDDFRSRCRDIAGAFGGPERVHYASKAFLSKKIAQWVNEEGLSLDVASLNELRIALASNFPAARITVHGNNKNHEFLTACVQENVGHVVIDSPQEIEQLDAVARENNSVQQVMVRVTPGVDAHTHEFIATSHEDQKFGIGLATGEAFAAVQSCLAADNLELVGLHCHVGSQVFDAEGFKLAAERILTLYSRIHTELGVTLQELDLGGGFGIPYIDTDTALDVSAVAADLLKAVANVADELDITPPTVLVEPGRALVGASAITVYEIGTIKDVTTGKGDIPVRRYYSVEGGLSDNIRPALYGAEYDARVVNRNTSGELAHARLVGSHCESGDILIEEAKFPSDIVTGDLLALAATGAYCYPMSSRYNAAFRPAVVSVAGGKAELMLRRETLEDLLSLEA